MANEINAPAKRILHWDSLPTTWKDETLVTDGVQSALARFSRDVPKLYDTGFIADGTTAVFDLSVVCSTWNEGESQAILVASPWTVEEENWLDEYGWRMIRHPTNGDTLVLTTQPVNLDLVVVRHFGRYTEDGVPVAIRPAVAKLAAAYVARSFAARRAAVGDQSINAAVAVGSSESSQWLDVAYRLEEAYRTEIQGYELAGALVVASPPDPYYPGKPGYLPEMS